MKAANIFLICILVLVGASSFAQNTISPSQKSPLTIGDQLEFYSDILGEKRIINIYLPLDYEADSSDNYPVIYLLDGGMDEDFIHIVGLAQFASFPWIDMMPKSIVVGIANIDRQRDFTFPTSNSRNQKGFSSSGQSKKFIQFLIEELQPIISQNYSNHPSKTLIGQSLGGLLATQILFQKPDSFTEYIIVSPSLWWDDESLLQERVNSTKNKKSVFIAVGKEGEIMERTARELAEKLKSLAPPTYSVYFNFLEEQDHGDVLHLAVYDAFGKNHSKSGSH